jgi:hypothetical protein
MNANKTTVILMILAAGGLLGCNILGPLLYFIVPEQKKWIEPEFAGLEKHSVAVVIYADEGVLFEYPTAKMELSGLIAAQLEDPNHAKDIKVVPPDQVLRYQVESINWQSMEKTKLGKVFGADYVLFVSLMQFTTHEEGSVNLYRGHITAEAALYQTSLPERHARVWPSGPTNAMISVVFPPHAPVGGFGDNDSKIRFETEKRFADTLAKKFYRYEVKEEDENPLRNSDLAPPGALGLDMFRVPADRLGRGAVRPAPEGRCRLQAAQGQEGPRLRG